MPFPSSLPRILASPLLPAGDKVRFLRYASTLLARQPGDLAVDERYDATGRGRGAGLRGRRGADRIVRPLFEGPFFSRLEEMSAALLRSWLRVLSVGTFFHVDGGMDVPWRYLGDLVGARTGVRVERVEVRGDGRVDVHTDAGTETADGCVLALPAPVAAGLLEGAPSWLADVPYAPHVRLYAARRAAGPTRSSIHVFPNDVVATVELGAGRWGALGRGASGVDLGAGVRAGGGQWRAPGHGPGRGHRPAVVEGAPARAPALRPVVGRRRAAHPVGARRAGRRAGVLPPPLGAQERAPRHPRR